jgi:hypothetical protein
MRSLPAAVALVALASLASVPGCAAAQAAAANDPQKCERDPKCRNNERAFDCNAQCTDDVACMDRCNQVQEQTGASAPH